MPMDQSNSSLLVESWDMLASLMYTFPKVEVDQLKNEQNYYIWSVQMQNVFESCEMWGVIDGSKTLPPDNKDHAIQHRIWKKKDSLTKDMITQCIKADLVIKVAHAKHAKKSWDIFATDSVAAAQLTTNWL